MKKITAAALLKAAQKEEAHALSDTLLQCAPAFYMLNQKGWSWVDIHKWAVAKGIDRTKASLVNATRSYAKSKKLKLR